MRSTAVVLALTLAATVGHAQEAEPLDVRSFRDLAASILADQGATDQWVKLLPTIARQCGMTVDREHVQSVRSRSSHRPAADRYAHRLDGRLQASWGAMVERDPDTACRTADSLWGESGTALPGILRDKAEGSIPVWLALAAVAP